MSIKDMQLAADLMAKANLGYDQNQRWTFLDKKNKKIIPNKETDCSASSGGIAFLGGYPVDLSGTFYTGNFAKKMAAAGFAIIPFKSLSQVKAGDFLLTPGHHVVFARTAKKFFSAEYDERGHSAGGKSGNQNGRETRYRTAYVRPGGWRYIVRPLTTDTFKGQTLKYFATGNRTKFAAANTILQKRAPYDGPLFTEFFSVWESYNAGMKLEYNPANVGVPQEKHAFVVLGSALKSDGTMPQKYSRRLDIAIQALMANLNSSVVISGGKPEKGKSEAQVGKEYVVAHGIDPKRVILEDKSSSTVGNAQNSVPLLVKNGFTSYTLVSDASHLRRASLLFKAAKLQRETAVNARDNLTSTTPLAYRDNGVTEAQVSSAAKLEIGKEIAYVLKLSAQFNAAK
jgi:vancomycin permeability regulator SanA